jgi:anti-sigma regulatory factor (Ser/Thr protein kinase)
MTMGYRIHSRYPVVVAALDGRLDYSNAIEAAVTLQGCLAEQPVQLVLDLAGVTEVTGDAVRPLAGVVGGARRWPGAKTAVGAAAPETGELVRALAREGVEVHPSTEAAVAAGQRLPVPPRVLQHLKPNREAPAAARELIAQTCREWGLDRWSRLTQLLASELVTNAVVHARTLMTVSLRRLGDTLEVAVRDGDPRLVARPQVGPEGLPVGAHGRGLLLLTTLADTWGCVPTSDGKVTWANVGLNHRGGGGGD